MLRLWLVPAVCCALCLGCGKSDDGGRAANQGQNPAAPLANANAQAGPASSNPMTNFFRGLDRAAKGTGGGQR